MPRPRRDRDRLAGDQVHALSHPLRLRILEMHTRMKSRPLSLETLTAALAQTPEYGDVRLAEVKYHRDTLLDADLLPERP
jgi:hypothetical protein